MEILSKIKSIPLSYFAYFLVVLILLGAIIYVYRNYVSSKLEPSYTDNNEYYDPTNNSNNTAEVIMFYVDWCPHCKNSMPAYDEFTSKYNQKTINGYKMKVTKFNCTNDEDTEVKNMVDKYDIEGFPTIILITNNQTIAFDAEATTENLEQFVDNVLS